MTSITKNIVKEQITDAILADIATTVSKLQKDYSVMEDNINKLFQLIGKPEDQKVESQDSNLESSKKNKNITEWLIKIHEMGNVPNDVVKILRKGLGMTLDAYKKSHKNDLKEGKEIKILIGLIMRDLNNTSSMTELIELFTSLNKEVVESELSNESDSSDESVEELPNKTPPSKQNIKKLTSKVVVKNDSSDESSDEESSDSDVKPVIKPKPAAKIAAKTAAKPKTVVKPKPVAKPKSAVKTVAKKITKIPQDLSSDDDD